MLGEGFDIEEGIGLAERRTFAFKQKLIIEFLGKGSAKTVLALLITDGLLRGRLCLGGRGESSQGEVGISKMDTHGSALGSCGGR